MKQTQTKRMKIFLMKCKLIFYYANWVIFINLLHKEMNISSHKNSETYWNALGELIYFQCRNLQSHLV